jgi:hypothetical protein
VPLQSGESANLLTEIFVGIRVAACVVVWLKLCGPSASIPGVRWTAALPFGDATTALQKERRPLENASPQTAQSLLTTDGTSAHPNRG